MTLQRRPAPDARTFIGEGKAEEVKALAEANDASLILFDNELSPSQMSNLEELTGRTVLDRSALILDIFAQRARTGEGKLQVELAQYQYILPRLAGMGKAMSRLGGGIGTRGPGESKLESDRRHIRSRIDKLRRDLEQVRQVRAVQRRQHGGDAGIGRGPDAGMGLVPLAVLLQQRLERIAGDIRRQGALHQLPCAVAHERPHLLRGAQGPAVDRQDVVHRADHIRQRVQQRAVHIK